MKKAKKQPVRAHLVDVTKRGTMIVGCPRLGTHYIQALCGYHAAQADLAVIEHGELNHMPGSPLYVDPNHIHSYLRQSMPGQYRLVILNSESHKLPLAASPAVLEDWHVIRVCDADPYRWFWSWFLFLHSDANAIADHMIYPALARLDIQSSKLQGRAMWFVGHPDQGHYYDAETQYYSHSWNRSRGDYQDAARAHTRCHDQLGHHGTSRQVYMRMLAALTDKLPLQPLLGWLPLALQNHMVSQMLPADQELEFKDLPQLANHVVEWRPNDYPQLDLGQVFKNADLLAAILDRWSGSWPGVFKEKQ